jgi:hypothetical protein
MLRLALLVLALFVPPTGDLHGNLDPDGAQAMDVHGNLDPNG